MLENKKSLSAWLQYIESKHIKTDVFDLRKIKYIANKINLLNLSSFVFLVGGTNGKGTTCFLLEKLLLTSGFRVGLYTSPHLLKYSERIRINGNILDDYRHIHAFSYIESIRENLSLTYFEFVTLSALCLFKEAQLDVIILEVGLGGRLDATNIVYADISVITNINLEHTDILGSSRELVGYEKAHIAKKNKIILIGDENIPCSMYNIIEKRKTTLKKFNYDWFIKRNKYTWNYISSNMLLYNLPYSQLAISNIAISLTALFYSPFKIKEDVIRYVITNLKLMGRFQIVSYYPIVILDVAHNPHATLYLSKKIKNLSKKGKIHAVMGVLKDKDIKNMIANLIELIDFWYCAPLAINRSCTIEDMCKILPKKFNIFNNIKHAWMSVKNKAKTEDVILVFGSFVTVSEVMKIINR